MAAVRAWHPVRLALVCAVLTMAGGASSARAVYAEVSARAVAAERAEARASVAQPAADAAVTSSSPPRSRTVTPPRQPAFVATRLYLAHCSLLL